MRKRALGSLTGLAVGVLLGGCGGAARPAAKAGAAGSPPPAAASDTPAGVAVIRSWAQALARGDVSAAGAYFATPSRVQINPGAPAATVRSAAEARSVNLLLTCGAKLLDARPVARYIDALFLLTRRPGADCGPGVGGTARVAFVIADGRIVVWRRIADEPGDSSRAAPGYQPPSPPGALPPGARSV